MTLKLRGTVVLLVSLASAGCVQTTEPTAPTVSSASPSLQNPSAHQQSIGESRRWPNTHAFHIETDVEVIPRKFVTGSPIEIVVSAWNTTHEPRVVATCPTTFVLFDETGENVGPFVVCAAFPDYYLLAPGERREWRLAQVGYWAPGRYTAYASIGGLPLQHPFIVQILTDEDPTQTK